MTKVKRRGHKKSTAGCEICKKRHLKCDETRPSCVNCITQGRKCPYLNEGDTSAPTEAATVPNPISTDDKSSLQAIDTFRVTPSRHFSPVIRLEPPTPGNVYIYTRLLQQWLTDTYSTFVTSSKHADIYGQTTFNLALEFPHLLHGMLALSALQLEQADLANQQPYQQLAEKLQNQALTAFNAMSPDLDEQSVLPAFLFSNITGVHQMCKCFMSSESGFDSFLDSFIECITLCRGVNVVIKGWWPFLMQSQLAPILAIGSQLRAEQEVEQSTPEFDGVRELIEKMKTTNSLETTSVYFESIAKLQWSFNVQCAMNSPELNRSTSWAFAWPMNVPSEFCKLLALRRPEALVILAHYAPLLHYRRPCWAIRGAGKLMLEQIQTYLGARWSQWLEWPREAIKILPSC